MSDIELEKLIALGVPLTSVLGCPDRPDWPQATLLVRKAIQTSLSQREKEALLAWLIALERNYNSSFRDSFRPRFSGVY